MDGIDQDEDRRGAKQARQRADHVVPASVGENEVGDHDIGPDPERRGLGDGCGLGFDREAGLLVEQGAHTLAR